MAKQRMINTKIWEDNWFNKLDPIEKLFFIYLLTNPMTNISGVYELSKGTIGRSTGLESRVVNEILERFEKANKVIYRDGWVVLVNFIKHQNYNSPKIKAGIALELENAPKELIKNINIPYGYGIDTVSHSNSNSNSNSNKGLSFESPSLSKLKEQINAVGPNQLKKQQSGLTPRQYVNARRAENGKPPIRTPRSKKQEETTAALSFVNYFRDRAAELHGFQFFKVNDESRNKKIRQLIIRAHKAVGDLKPLIDWWLNGEGEWADYEPEGCFTTRTIERFQNKSQPTPIIKIKTKQNG